jgi:protein-S-isoprenylcysteine O-methyltransferase Ste14
MMKHLISILVLPFNVTLTIPWLFLLLESRTNTYFNWNGLPWFWIGLVFLIDGLFLLSWTITLFATKGKGTLAPWAPTKVLVLSGPYRHVRNPMISGVVFILIGEAMMCQSFWLLGWATFFFLLNNFYFILKEEPDLMIRFGGFYDNYKQNVKRWIPRINPWDPAEN